MTVANALDKARQALASARDKISEWDRALDTARADRERAEQTAPADPAELDQYADTYTRAAGKIRAAEQGRKVAASAEVAALEEVVRAGLEDAKADVKAARKAHDDHRRKLDALLVKVSELDGADYRPVTLEDLDDGLGVQIGASVTLSRAAMLAGTVEQHEETVNRLTAVLNTGEVASQNRPHVPAYALEYADALRTSGLPTPAEAQRAAQLEHDRLAEQREAERLAGMTDAEREAEHRANIRARDAEWAKVGR